MSARLFIFFDIFHQLFVRRQRHPPMSPDFETERSNSAEHGENSAKQKPNGDGHVLGRFTILRAVTKRTRARLLRGKQDRSAYTQGYGATSHRKNVQEIFHAMRRS